MSQTPKKIRQGLCIFRTSKPYQAATKLGCFPKELHFHNEKINLAKSQKHSAQYRTKEITCHISSPQMYSQNRFFKLIPSSSLERISLKINFPNQQQNEQQECHRKLKKNILRLFKHCKRLKKLSLSIQQENSAHSSIFKASLIMLRSLEHLELNVNYCSLGTIRDLKELYSLSFVRRSFPKLRFNGLGLAISDNLWKDENFKLYVNSVNRVLEAVESLERRTRIMTNVKIDIPYNKMFEQVAGKDWLRMLNNSSIINNLHVLTTNDLKNFSILTLAIKNKRNLKEFGFCSFGQLEASDKKNLAEMLSSLASLKNLSLEIYNIEDLAFWSPLLANIEALSRLTSFKFSSNGPGATSNQAIISLAKCLQTMSPHLRVLNLNIGRALNEKKMGSIGKIALQQLFKTLAYQKKLQEFSLNFAGIDNLVKDTELGVLWESLERLRILRVLELNVVLEIQQGATFGKIAKALGNLKSIERLSLNLSKSSAIDSGVWSVIFEEIENSLEFLSDFTLVMKCDELDEALCWSLVKLLKSLRFLEKLKLTLEYKIQNSLGLLEVTHAINSLQKKRNVKVRFTTVFDPQQRGFTTFDQALMENESFMVSD